MFERRRDPRERLRIVDQKNVLKFGVNAWHLHLLGSCFYSHRWSTYSGRAAASGSNYILSSTLCNSMSMNFHVNVSMAYRGYMSPLQTIHAIGRPLSGRGWPRALLYSWYKSNQGWFFKLNPGFRGFLGVSPPNRRNAEVLGKKEVNWCKNERSWSSVSKWD